LNRPDLTTLPQSFLAFWQEYHLCTLSTLDRDGAPHAVPVGATLDLAEGCAWVITRAGSQKVRNIQRDPRLSITQVDRGRWASLVGTGEIRTDAASIARACDLYAARYRPPTPNPQRVAIRVAITRVLGSTQVLPGAS